MSADVNWNDIDPIEVPAGAYVGWGSKVGQKVIGTVTEYQERGGTDFNGNVCPEVSIILAERAASFNKAGDRTDFDADEEVGVTCGGVNLKKAIRKAAPERGDLIKIELIELVKTPNGTAKIFDVRVKRGGGAKPAPAQSSRPIDDEPPF